MKYLLNQKLLLLKKSGIISSAIVGVGGFSKEVLFKPSKNEDYNSLDYLCVRKPISF